MKVIFTVPGEPQGKARARTCGGHTYTPEKTVLYENLIKTEYARQCGNRKFSILSDGTAQPVAVRIEAVYGIPKSYSKKKKNIAETAMVVSSLAKQMINNADVVLRTEKLVSEGKLKGASIKKMIGDDVSETV